MKQAALILALLGIPLFVVGSIWMFSGKPILRKSVEKDLEAQGILFLVMGAVLIFASVEFW